MRHSLQGEHIRRMQCLIHGSDEGAGLHSVLPRVQGVQRHQQLRRREQGVCRQASTLAL
jgi:hypothetical protein